MRRPISVGCTVLMLTVACGGQGEQKKSGPTTSDKAIPTPATGKEQGHATAIIDSATQLGDTTTTAQQPSPNPPTDAGEFQVSPRPKTPGGQESGGGGSQPKTPGVSDTASRGPASGPGTSDTASRPRGTQPGVSDTGAGARLLRRPIKPLAGEMMMKRQPSAAAARQRVVRDTLVAKRKP